MKEPKITRCIKCGRACACKRVNRKLGGGRAKGHGFERQVAKMLYETAGLEKKDCYRTPMSGGHQHAGQGDLQMTKRMRKLFPFLVECKFYNNIPVLSILSDGPTVVVQGWIEQAKASEARESKKGRKAAWMVLMKQNNGPTIAVADKRLLTYLRKQIVELRYEGALLRFRHQDAQCFAVSFSVVLKALARKAKQWRLATR